MLLSLALRNLARNRRRSILTALGVGFGTAALVLFQGFIEGFIGTGIDASVLGRVGAIQVQRKGYIGADEPLKLALGQDPELVLRLSGVPGITAVAPRLAFDGMVSNGADSTLFSAVAIDAALEYRVCPGRATTVTPGTAPLTKDDAGRALVGKSLAASLGARRGSSLLMQSASPNAAGTNALDVEVAGTLSTLDFAESKHLMTVPLSFAQDLLRMPGQVTSYVASVADVDDVVAVAARVTAALNGPDGAGNLEVTTWRDVDVRLREEIAQARGIFGFVALVLFLLVAAGIVNTVNLTVQERVREIGTMLAVGMKRRQVMQLFLAEAAVLGFISGSAGASAGWVVVGVLGARGVLLHPPGGDVLTVRPHVGVGFVLGVLAFAVAGAVVAALRPAWRASRRSPVEALGSI
jgi:putative ABC transport system permease protein